MCFLLIWCQTSKYPKNDVETFVYWNKWPVTQCNEKFENHPSMYKMYNDRKQK